jgi:hypothetical protein
MQLLHCRMVSKGGAGLVVFERLYGRPDVSGQRAQTWQLLSRVCLAACQQTV